ncbi:MAG: UDP-N-acetylmuramoyl-L-alanyl-D-glutamate--2,6-diaminopimelate ligase, partial [Bacteroidota bacterium]
MKLLQDILYKAGIEDVVGSTHIAIEHLCFDSRSVEQFSAFVAIRGVQVDGHAYIDQAIESGATAVVCETFPETFREKVTYVKVANGQRALGQMAANFYGNPSEELELIGVTGTNGKTTTVTLLYELFEALGKKTGLLSTVRNRIHRQTVAATHTTPDALQLNQLLREMVDQGCQYCFMEVSSHAIHQDRIAGLHFRGGVFTNITHDHLDYHKSFDEYIKAKKKFFDEIGSGAFALVNRDDFHSEVMVQNTTAKVKTYALKTLADFKGRILENQFSGLQLNIDGSEVWTKLIGGFNAYNVLAAYSVAVLLDKDG